MPNNTHTLVPYIISNGGIEVYEEQPHPKKKDYKAEYKKMKAKLALLEASPSSSENPKSFQPKNKGLVAETFDWDEEEVMRKKSLKSRY
ncbi:hypothetical protein Tco_1057207 [Tanacetum coccineum]|uniref:Uncharacterized protein n=1 Tax=Tanacetum coccineum TaxID=301880 RepID=A0ABQ5H4Q2_9ASTR